MAAKLLSSAGQKILLLEARKQLGGRIAHVDGFLTPAEGGAEFIHGNLKTTSALLKEANLKKEKVKGQFCRVEHGLWEVNNEIVPHWDSLVKRMKLCDLDMSVHDFLQYFFHENKYDALRKQFTKYVEGYDAADTKNASIFAVRKEMEEADENQYRPRPGYFALIDFLEKECLKHGVAIKKDEPVLQLDGERNIEATTSAAKYICRKIIIAVPLGVLQCGRGDKGYIHFPARLKRHINAAKTMGNGGVIKFLMEFDEPFWLDKRFLENKNIPPPSYIFTDAIIPTWWTQYPSRYPLITGWLAGPASYRMKNHSENKLKKLAIETLASVFSMHVKVLDKKLMMHRVVNWINEPYISGGYSYATLYTEKASGVLRQPVDNAFYFAGEYIAEDASSTVDAALQSGKEVAEKILTAK